MNMYQRKWVINIWYILILTDIIVLVPASNAIGYETPLDRNKLREKYGQGIYFYHRKKFLVGFKMIYFRRYKI